MCICFLSKHCVGGESYGREDQMFVSAAAGSSVRGMPQKTRTYTLFELTVLANEALQSLKSLQHSFICPNCP